MTDQPACSDALTRVYPYLDRELSGWRRWWVRRHLRKCGPCVDVYEFEGRLKVMLKERCSEEVPDDVVDRLTAFLRANDADC